MSFFPPSVLRYTSIFLRIDIPLFLVFITFHLVYDVMIHCSGGKRERENRREGKRERGKEGGDREGGRKGGKVKMS